MRSDFKKLDSFPLETWKNHLIYATGDLGLKKWIIDNKQIAYENVMTVVYACACFNYDTLKKFAVEKYI